MTWYALSAMKKKPAYRIRNWSEYNPSLKQRGSGAIWVSSEAVENCWSNPRHLVVDSTGVKVYGKGEWKVRQHGVGKRRTWRKLHFCVDEATLEIISVVASTNDVSDAEALPDLLQDVPGEIEQVSADSAYDQRRCYDTLNCHQARAAIPPRKGARIWSHANSKAERHARDKNLRRIRKVGPKEPPFFVNRE